MTGAARTASPPGATAYVAATTLLALLALAWSSNGAHAPEPTALVGLVVLSIAVIWVGEIEVSPTVTISLSSVLLLCAAAVLGPLGAGLLGVFVGVLTRGTKTGLARLFNAGASVILGVVGAWAYDLAGGDRDLETLHGAMSLLRDLGLPLVVADLAIVVVNALLIAGIVRISQGVPIRQVAGRLLQSASIYVAYGILAFLLLLLWFPAGVGPVSALLLLVPLLSAHWTHVQYRAQQTAQEDSLHVLVGAIEHNLPDLAGHSERVADLAGHAAAQLGLSVAEVADVRRAAMLHDLGRIGHESGVAPGHQRRVRQGAAMVDGLTFLSGAREVLDDLAKDPADRGLAAQVVGASAALDRALVLEPDGRSARQVVADLQRSGLAGPRLGEALLRSHDRVRGRVAP